MLRPAEPRLRRHFRRLGRLALLAGLLCWTPVLYAAIVFKGAEQARADSQVGIRPQYVGSATASSGASVQSSITVSRPAGTAAGHVLIAQLVLKGVVAPGTAPPGWTLLDTVSTTGADPVTQTVYWRVATAGEPASYTWSWASNVRVVAAVMAFQNVETTNPFDVWGSRANNASATISLPTLTTSASNEMLVALLGSSLGGSHSTVSGMTERYDLNSQPGGQPAKGVTGSGDTQLQATPGSTGTKTATLSGGAADNIAHLLALRPRGALTINVPAATTAGDIMIASVTYRPCSATSGNPCTTTVTTPAGWTLIRSVDTTTGAGTDGYGSRLLVYRRLASASEPASYTWYFGGTPVHAGAVGGILTFSGVDTSDPILVENGQATPSSNSHTAPSVNTGTVAGGMLVTSHSVNSSGTWTPPAGMDERVDIASLNPPNALGIALEVNTQLLPAAGATGTRTATLSNPPQGDTGGTHSLVLRPSTPATVVGGFNAYDTATAAGAITGFIKTKVAGAAFNLDLIALNAGKTAIEPGFAGAVKVELLDASNNTGTLDANGCRSSWTVIQTLSPNPVFAGGDNGRKTVAFQENNAWRDVRVRISYPATGTPTAVGCSNDNFAIRPASLNWAATDADWQTPGTARALANGSAGGGAVHKAGRPFTLTATALNAAGNVTSRYDGTPAAVVVACTLPASCSPGTLATGAWTASSGTVVSNGATYPEVGVISVRLEDANFAAVDGADGSTLLDRTIPGATQTVGRFVPDHFELVPANTPQLKTFNTTTCTPRSFTYIGQPFGYVTAPVATIAAKNAAGATTVNYAGSLWKLTAGDVNQSYTSVPATPALTANIGAPTVLSNNDGTGSVLVNGGDTLAYTRTASAPWPAPFNASISLALSVQDASENGPGQGIITTAAPAVFNGGGGGITFDAGNTFRFGRVRLVNAHGSERLPLAVPMVAEWFDGTVFRINTDDNCNSFTAGQVSFSNWVRNLNPGETSVTGVSFGNGRGAISLSAPGVGNSGAVDLTLDVPAWLEFPWTGAGMVDPKARATFGIYRSGGNMIYRRESY